MGPEKPVRVTNYKNSVSRVKLDGDAENHLRFQKFLNPAELKAKNLFLTVFGGIK